MFKGFLTHLKRGGGGEGQAARSGLVPEKHITSVPDGTHTPEKLIYPPVDTGIPSTVTPGEIVDGHDVLIDRIYRTAGVSREVFATYYQPAISNLATYIHALPATAGAYYRGAGGLLRMSLEIGLYSLQGANATIFPIAGGIERRHLMHPKWALGTFLAGICSQLYRAVSHVAVTTIDGSQWPALRMPLFDWTESIAAHKYFIRWLEEPNGVTGRAAGTFAVPLVIPGQVLQYLSDDNHHVLGAMASAIAGADVYSRENAISRILAPILSRIIDEDVRRSPTNYGQMTVGMHLEPYLIDAMRQLVREGTWAVNTEKAIIWNGEDGTYLRWSQAVRDLQTIMSRDGFGGVPRDPDVLAGILIKAGVFETRDVNTTSWTIILPDSGEVVEGAVKLAQSDLLFSPEFPATQGTWTLMAPAINSASQKSAPKSEPSKDDVPTVVEEQGKPHQTPTPTPPHNASGRSDQDINKSSAESADPGRKSEPQKTNTSAAAEVDPIGDLKPGNAWLLREIIKAYKEGRLTGEIRQLNQGVGISQDELSAYGQQLKDFVDELKAKQWLWVDLKNPSRHLHRLQDGDANMRWLILRPDIARRVGLKD